MRVVGLYGPVADAFGGSGVGGLATHGTEVAQALPAHDVRVSYLADNLHARGPLEAPWGTLRGVAGARGRAEALRIRLSPTGRSRGAYRRASIDSRREDHNIPLARAFSRAYLIAEGCRGDQAEILHVQQPDYRPLFAGWAATGLPTLLAVHGLGVADADPGGPVEHLVRENLSVADMLTAPSRFLADAAIALGANPDRMHIVPNAVDHELFSPRSQAECRSRLGLDPSRPLIVFLGRAIDMKGAPELLEAARIVRESLPGSQVAFVGTWSLPVPHDSALYEMDPSAPVLIHEGALKADLPLWLCAADAVAIPSRYEGFGLVALEALACARPVVLSRVGGLPEVVPEGAGAFVEPQDPDALAACLLSVISSPERASSLSAAGPAVAARYSWDATAARYAELYEELALASSSA